MASKGFNRHIKQFTNCLKKSSFRNGDTALKRAKQVCLENEKKGGPFLSPYYCPLCGKHHLTKDDTVMTSIKEARKNE